MPKTTDTRKQRANELHMRLQRGPSLGDAEMERRVRGWLETWVISEVISLVPELKGRRPYPMEDEPGHIK